LCKAIETVYENHRDKNVTLRASAYMIALKKLVTAKKTRGIFP